MRKTLPGIWIAFVIMIGVPILLLADSNETKKQPQFSRSRINILETGDSYSNHSTVKVLDHNSDIRIMENKKNYYEHEVTVKFIKVPIQQELSKITTDINGQIMKHIGSIYYFKSKNLKTAQLIQYFRQIENIAYVEPSYILLQNQTE